MSNRGDSNLSGFHRLALGERRALLAERGSLTAGDLRVLSGEAGLTDDQANHMVENALGIVGVPLGLCAHLRVNGRDRLVLMATEEPSVLAGASHAAKLIRAGGGVRTTASGQLVVGQIQVLDVIDLDAARKAVLGARDRLVARANETDPGLLAVGGGAVDVEVRALPPLADPWDDDPLGPMLIVELVVDVRDAMGANAVNTMCEHLAPSIEDLTGGRVRLRIISNLADRRTVEATARVPFSALVGKGCASPEELARGVEEASVFAERDPYRAATHNKGILNGVDAVLLAFGQDFRAVEAGAHAYAARGGRYTALSRWRVVDGALEGRLRIPMSVGVVGGIARVHPTVGVARRLARVEGAADLASITAAVGLAQNLGALRALAAEGIQAGHMRSHARNIAVGAGATGDEVDRVARALAKQRTYDVGTARQLLAWLRGDERPESGTPEPRAQAGDSDNGNGHAAGSHAAGSHAAGSNGNGSHAAGNGNGSHAAGNGNGSNGAGSNGAGRSGAGGNGKGNGNETHVDAPATIDFGVLQRTYLPRILALAGAVVDGACPEGSSLGEMFRYQMETGGKRLRALLPLCVAGALEADAATLVPFSAACETLHNATLVHDDLQDGDTTRRGRETIWRRFGEAQAINLGDAMYHFALQMLERLTAAEARERASARLLQTTVQVLDGQEREWQLRRIEQPQLADYLEMVEAKTSGLFALPLAGGAELCGASAEVVTALERAARQIGVLFQIQDDVLDLYGDKGRDARGSDIAEGKRSVLIVHALRVLEQHDQSTESRRLRRILDLRRDETGPAQIAEAMALIERTGALSFALDELGRREQLALAAVRAAGDARLTAMITGICRRFVAPIDDVIARERRTQAAAVPSMPPQAPRPS